MPASILNAQDERVVEAIQNSDYIFQGRFLDIKLIQKVDEKQYVSFKFLVENVYKEKKTLEVGDTIELVSFLPKDWAFVNDNSYGRMGDYELEYPYNKGFMINSDMSVLLFTKKNVTSFTKNVPNVVLSLGPTQSYDDYYFFNRRPWKTDSINHRAYQVDQIIGFGKEFNSQEEFQNYLKERGLDITQQSDKKKDVSSAEEINNQKVYAERVKTYNEYLNILNERAKTKTIFNPKSSETITVEVQNQKITCEPSLSKTFYEYDIFISGNSSNTYLDNIVFVTEYNQNAFGSNVSANNNIQITRGSSFNNTTYIDPMSMVILVETISYLHL